MNPGTHNVLFRGLLFALLFLATAYGVNAAGLKVHISADMEGVAGVVSRDQLGPKGFEYGQFRKFMTAEVNAAIEAARDAGATEIVVSDSHGNGLNLLLDALPQDIQLVRSWPRPLGMMEGIDDSFGAAIFIGYHASAGNTDGTLAHTQSGADFSSVKINGIEMTEGGMSALIAGHFGVPVVMISGDDAAVREVSDMLGPIEGAVVKWHSSHTSARTLMPEAAQALIKEKVQAGLKRRQELEPFRIEGPLTLDLTYKNATAAEMIAYLPNVELIDNHTVRFVGSIIEISMFVEMALGYPPTMTH
ncbi:MAG: M55 family metallopeptidase [Gammaproteobacteria bacterium]|nr:M55 family metallopeptidase [Gammaproteobacteria bacterium]